METQIKATLTALLAGIQTADGPAITAEMEKLDGLLERGRGALHPQLAHFLARRSYAKAHAWLGGTGPGGQNPPGGCSGGKAEGLKS